MAQEALSEASVIAMHSALTEFGYQVDRDYVREQANRLVDGQERPRSGPEGFLAIWLKDAGIRQEQTPRA